MLDVILLNIRKARMKKFSINLLIALLFAFLSLCSFSNRDSNLLIIGILFMTLTAVFLFLAWRYLVLSFNCDGSTFFVRLSKIGNRAQIANYFSEQLKQTIVEDEKVIITPDLYVLKSNYEQTLINDEIIDITHLVHKTNFVIDYISIIVRYSDGKKYKVKYRRPLGISNMEQKAKNTRIIANILAENCKNLRKNGCYK